METDYSKNFQKTAHDRCVVTLVGGDPTMRPEIINVFL
jgi:hypothetical protein